jgi:hypothetical protein
MNAQVRCGSVEPNNKCVADMRARPLFPVRNAREFVLHTTRVRKHRGAERPTCPRQREVTVRTATNAIGRSSSSRTFEKLRDHRLGRPD